MKKWLLENLFHREKYESIEKQVSANSSTMPYEPIVFVNKPISSIDDDIVGFRSQIETIKEAIDSGADMIALVADYGAGKSSIADILYKDDINYQKIRINLWDSISTKTNGSTNNQNDDENNSESINENISLLTKSFLYQLANGYDAKRGLSEILCKLQNDNIILSFLRDEIHFTGFHPLVAI